MKNREVENDKAVKRNSITFLNKSCSNFYHLLTQSLGSLITDLIEDLLNRKIVHELFSIKIVHDMMEGKIDRVKIQRSIKF